MVFELLGSKKRVLTRVYKVFGARGLKNLAIFKVSDLGSKGHLVDLGQENASVWSVGSPGWVARGRPTRDPPGGTQHDTTRRHDNNLKPTRPQVNAREQLLRYGGQNPPHSDKFK